MKLNVMHTAAIRSDIAKHNQKMQKMSKNIIPPTPITIDPANMMLPALNLKGIANFFKSLLH